MLRNQIELELGFANVEIVSKTIDGSFFFISNFRTGKLLSSFVSVLTKGKDDRTRLVIRRAMRSASLVRVMNTLIIIIAFTLHASPFTEIQAVTFSKHFTMNINMTFKYVQHVSNKSLKGEGEAFRDLIVY